MSQHERLRVRPWVRLTTLAIAVLVTVSAGAYAGELSPCIRANVPAPVVLPDGTKGDAGLLRICYRRAFTPVVGLDEISVGRITLGMFPSRTSTVGQPQHERLNPIGARPYMVFLRNGGGELVLLSYHRTVRGKVSSHVLLPSGKPQVRSYWRIVAGSGEKEQPFDLATVLDRDDTVVLKAADF